MFCGDRCIYKKEMCCCKCDRGRFKIIKPSYVATASEGLVQSDFCKYFYGTHPRVTFGNGEIAVVLIQNPTDSGRAMYLNKFSYANYSDVPISVEVYISPEIQTTLQNSTRIAAGNLGCETYKTNKGAILYGENVTFSNGTNIYNRTVPAYNTVDSTTGGSVILCPGDSIAYVFNTIEDTDVAEATLSVAWWEEGIC